MHDLSGRTAIVTGASRGIGRRIAERLAEHDAGVVVNYPDKAERSDAESVVEGIRGGGGSARAIRADVSDEDEVERLFGLAVSELDRPDVLVNNAGVGSAMSLEAMETEDWDRVMDVNLRGVFLCSRAAVRTMDPTESAPGRIINVASQLAFKGETNMTHYCASKGGIVSFTRSLAREVAPTITVNAVAPGPVDTRMLRENTTEEWRAERRETIPLGRIGDPDDIAPSVVFLASDAGGYYTGQTLSPDGGDAMH